MKAITYSAFGGPEVLKLEQLSRPAAITGEVVVRILAAGVLPVDWKIRKGLFPMPVKFPAIPGTAFSGIIEEVGPGVAGFKRGQAVFGRSTAGTYAEFTAVSAESIAMKPKSISFEEAASISGGATTAWRAIMGGQVKKGDRVLIHGAAGGVGLFAVQFAKLRGAYVIGTAGSDNIAFIQSLGVDQPIDYRAVMFEQEAKDIDFVLDTIGGETLERSWSIVKKGGRLMTITGQPPLERGKALGIEVIPSSLASSRDLEEIAELLGSQQVKAFVQSVHPLAEAREAHIRSEAGHGRGRIV
ncbi:NADP-dependent oxidoreductase, partial [Paenibacillus sp. MCAF20]